MVYFVLAVLCGSHAQHFEFMGIPIDGSIEAFDSKLKAKGFVKSPETNSEIKNVRYYDGPYCGNKAFLLVRATSCDKVCSVSVFCDFNNADTSKEMWTFLINSIEEKYPVKKIKEESSKKVRYKLGNGEILVEYGYSEDEPYMVHICYMDMENVLLFKKEMKEDI